MFSKYELWKKRGMKISKGYFRRMSTYQEMRINSDIQHKKFVRAKRRPKYLEPWNIEKHAVIQGTWKGLKIKKQWEEKLK